MAADTIIVAKEKGDFTAKTLSMYEKLLKESFVLHDLKANKEMPEFLDNDDLYTFYPERFPDFLEEIIWFGEGPKKKIGKTFWNEIKSSGMLGFRRLRDIYRIKNL
jgi:electron transfer flavoprotein-quinone oxidoreductase